MLWTINYRCNSNIKYFPCLGIRKTTVSFYKIKSNFKILLYHSPREKISIRASTILLRYGANQLASKIGKSQRRDETRRGRRGGFVRLAVPYITWPRVGTPTRKWGTDKKWKKGERESRNFVTWGERCREKEGELGKMAGAILRD